MGQPSQADRDTAAHARRVVWVGVLAVVATVATVLVTVGTSTNWFCTQPCHVVHADNTKTFEAGAHARVSCVACHEPVNASPIVFLLKKIEVAPDLLATVGGTFGMPLNPDSVVAIETPDAACTQCHDLETRRATPSEGIVIDHAAHTKRGITCATCHNRAAHPEAGVTYELPGNRKHEDWLMMTACFRCHALEQPRPAREFEAPGACSACHTRGFDLVPATHDAPDWYNRFGDSTGHAAAYRAEASQTAEASAAPPVVEHTAGPVLRPAAAINECYTCHTHAFCTDCHGLEMPHPPGFAKSHGAAGIASPATCARCHARSEAEARGRGFCTACHHPESTPGRAWRTQHDEVVAKRGATACFGCHEPPYCAACHVRGPQAAEALLR